MHHQANLPENLSADVSSSTAPTSLPVHPIELTVQSFIESPLEILNLNSNSLYESQLILTTILKKLESKLEQSLRNVKGKDTERSVQQEDNPISTNNGNNDINGNNQGTSLQDLDGTGLDEGEVDMAMSDDEEINLQRYSDRVTALKAKLSGIDSTLKIVEKRVDKIMAHMDVQ
ncbi:hypothetical protein CANARDRAFT_26459 [[Candida] arabinofermentans NRRL YB-2248]|uniref:Uncharacterized protein n=1 Tax=[Candida] arabinofermentans NRRL YB-2248 TaxID=983967 RepID=A0A1E4T998_9ASCO|nr:hypothetical protein CANARDRAFT_26459 [[Candida] arabinofermentans NRRL YB-2248]